MEEEKELSSTRSPSSSDSGSCLFVGLAGVFPGVGYEEGLEEKEDEEGGLRMSWMGLGETEEKEGSQDGSCSGEGVEERRYSLSRESYEVEQVMMRHWIMLGRVVYVRL